MSGCAELRIGDVYQSPPLQDMGISCMNQLNEQFSRYMKQEVPEGEIRNLSTCLQTSLIAFKNHVWGEEREVYTPQELRDFIQKFFLTDQVIEDDTIHQLMVLKTKYTQGSETLLTHQEVDQIIFLIQAFEEFMSAIYPYNTVLFGDEIPSPEKLEESLIVLRQNLQKLLTTIMNQPYLLDELPLLYKEVHTLVRKSPPEEIPIFIKVLKPLASFIFNNPDKQEISKEEWTKLIDGALDTYSFWRYTQLASQTSFFDQKIDYYSHSVEELITLLKNRIHSPEYNLSIPQENILSLFEKLHEQGVFPQRIRLTSLQSVLEIVFGKILNRGDSSLTLTLESLDWFENEYKRWKSLQNVLNNIHPVQYSYPPQAIRIPELRELPPDVRTDFYSLFNFKTLFNEDVDSDFNTYLTYEGYLSPAGYKNLSMRSFYLSLIRAIGQGYSFQYPSQGITASELTEFLTQIYGWVQDIEIENSSLPPNETAFMVAHLVTYASQGYYNDIFVEEENRKIELIEQKEGIEYLSFVQLLMNSLNSVYFKLQELCQREDITTGCFDSYILTALEELQNSMPHLIEDISTLSEEEKRNYKDTLLKMALLQESEISQALSNKESYVIRPLYLRNLMYGFIFQESTFTRFDTNQNYILDDEELASAFPLYEGLISSSLEASNRQNYSRAGYDYSIQNLRLPYGADQSRFWTNFQIGWIRWVNRPHIQLTRPQFLELASNLMIQLRNLPSQTQEEEEEVAED